MNTALVDKIVNAVLYEGYILYPYRPCIKNQQRCMFGCVYPEASEGVKSGAERSAIQTECLVEGNDKSSIEVEVRFLQMLRRRQIVRPEEIDNSFNSNPRHRPTESLDVDGSTYETWDEAIERHIVCGPRSIAELIGADINIPFVFKNARTIPYLQSTGGKVEGAPLRECSPVEGMVELSAAHVGESLYSVRARVLNASTPVTSAGCDRSTILRQALVSTHTILSVTGGDFVSLTDPPDPWHVIASTLRNDGVWPVLVGEQGQRSMMLSSPIILSDYPQVASESAGDLFDATEIDEILSLRVLTMTDDEKRQMRQCDDRAREILRRTETLPSDQFQKLHGAIRGLRMTEVTGESA